jgi:hypothetical protein
MKHEISILVVSPRKSLFCAVVEGAALIDHAIQVSHTNDVRAAISLVDQIGLSADKLQIYLDSTFSSAEAQRFVRLLDQKFRGISRNSVVLIDDASSVSGLVSLAMAECVWDVLNFPVLPIEVETAIRKRFYPARAKTHPNQVI